MEEVGIRRRSWKGQQSLEGDVWQIHTKQEVVTGPAPPHSWAPGLRASVGPYAPHLHPLKESKNHCPPFALLTASASYSWLIITESIK